jgi:hypothetical protein
VRTLFHQTPVVQKRVKIKLPDCADHYTFRADHSLSCWLCEPDYQSTNYCSVYLRGAHNDSNGREYAGAVTIGADVVVMVNDTPAARSFMTYLAGAQVQEAWIKLGGFTPVNRSISQKTYPDPVARAVAKELAEARISRFGAGDMMSTLLQNAW